MRSSTRGNWNGGIAEWSSVKRLMPHRGKMRYDSMMNRGAFLFGVLAVVAAAPAADVEIPAELRGGRFFAVPHVSDGRVFACWLDTDGNGFVFDSAVETFGLTAHKVDGKRRAMLPSLLPSSFPPLSTARDLPVFERGAQERADPILQGFDAQLGRTWFQGRTWQFDWPRGRCTMLAGTLDASNANVPITIENGVPRIPVAVAGENLTMTFDIAASVAMNSNTAVRATTFVPQALLDRWHRTHPDWRFARNVGVPQGIDRIVVPEMRAGSVVLRNVECTTRPGDDVFEGEDVNGKLGANAFAGCVAILDYRTSRLKLC